MDRTVAIKTAGSTPSSSPGLYSPTTPATPTAQIPSLDGTPQSSPYLHPLQSNPHKVKETHKAFKDNDAYTGRKIINDYEIIDEIGRGQHGKVKLARSLLDGSMVAIKIIQRFSKKRRLGKLTWDPESKTKREVAILKKVRHPNIVGLLEVIDDPEMKKIYLVLEHVELGEIQWRNKGNPKICLYERHRLDREMDGLRDTGEEETFFKMQDRRKQRKDAQRSKRSTFQLGQGQADHWDTRYNDDVGEPTTDQPISRGSRQNSQVSLSYRSGPRSGPTSRVTSRATSRAPSGANSRSHTPLPEYDIPALDSDNEDDEPQPPPPTGSYQGSSAALDPSPYGSFPDDFHAIRGRALSMADSVTSFMSSAEGGYEEPDLFEEEFSYVPTFTIEQARKAFRETVLGLEYLHYEGIVHRDIKPANLLWTKDHRVKISDFGVSYFGRPIREGETEENVSEADATDFDDDMELAKTVGTPAYFAPELCYTNAEIEQPKVTEQIDVWSLGVTLYGLIYARLPFLAVSEYEMWAMIAKNPIYLSKKRLKVVGPVQHPTGPYRAATELAYEEVDDELRDLLNRMLIKDPADRIKLREVKRHPWILHGIDSVMGWIDDTDPARQTAGRRIEVDRAELDHAVVPLTLLERARSALKKTVNKLGLVRPGSEGSRRRAVSSATSSGADLHTPHTPSTPYTDEVRETRRASLRGDEQYFTSASDLQELERPSEHPLAQSVTASPDLSIRDDGSFSLKSVPNTPMVDAPRRARSGTTVDTRPDLPDRAVSEAASVQTVVYRADSSRSTSFIDAPGQTIVEEDVADGYFTDHRGNLVTSHSTRSISTTNSSLPRTKSTDRGVFALDNKHSQPSLAISNAYAPGHIESSPTTPMLHDRPVPFPIFQRSDLVRRQVSHNHSSPNVPKSALSADNIDQRPATATRNIEAKTPLPRVYRPSTPESFERAQEAFERRRLLEDKEEKRLAAQAERERARLARRCPPSPDDISFMRKQDEAGRVQSSSSVNTNSVPSHLTSPELVSPNSSMNMGSPEQFFPSVPSLPALVSSGSSLCADPEGEFLQQPGIIPARGVFGTRSTEDTITPPILSEKGSLDGEAQTLPREQLFRDAMSTDDEGYNGDGDTMLADASDSDSDEGLMMGSLKKRVVAPISIIPRRGTSASVGSTDTAKKVFVDR